jgi:hypothetical protein
VANEPPCPEGPFYVVIKSLHVAAGAKINWPMWNHFGILGVSRRPTYEGPFDVACC